MATLRILVADGNPREGRQRHKAAYGASSSESYVSLLQDLAPRSQFEIVTPADAEASAPSGGIGSFDAVVFTGSQLHVAEGGPEVDRQLELMRETLRARVPAFGSCWGVQLAGVAAGGEAKRNPGGPEYGFARGLAPTPEGRQHPMLAGRPPAYDAPAIHLDAVVTPPPGAAVLASNAVLQVQAVEIRHEGGLFWGTQYHPELHLLELGVMLEQFAKELVEEGLCASDADAKSFAADLKLLHGDPGRRDLAWRHALNGEVLDPNRRTCEIRNFLAEVVGPTASRRGRA